ncbi:MAG TPA: AI-2E family transporter [Ilumatobacteraceae bacterium]|nr:AI-2E family transporter [Ilumatobacteraceae bacterium]
MAEQPVPRAAVVRAGLTPSAAVLVVGAVVTAFVLAGAFELAHRTAGWVVACSVVALLIDPLVTAVSRVLPRWLSVIVVLLLVMAVIAVLVTGLASDLLDSLDDLKENAPVAAQSLQDRYDWLERVDVAERVGDFVEDLDSQVRRDAVSEAIGTAPTYVVTGILMLFLLAYGRRYFDSFADQFGAERRDRIRRVGHDAATRGRRYLLIVIGQSVLNGAVVGMTCWLLDLPAAFSLGFLSGVLTVLPLIGVIVGGIPALLLAFGLDGWSTTLWLLLVLLVLQTIEAAVVRPIVDPRTVRVGPTIPIIVGLLGFELYGVGGAVYGIALAVIGLAALDSAGRIRGEQDEPAPAVT